MEHLHMRPDLSAPSESHVCLRRPCTYCAVINGHSLPEIGREVIDDEVVRAYSRLPAAAQRLVAGLIAELTAALTD